MRRGIVTVACCIYFAATAAAQAPSADSSAWGTRAPTIPIVFTFSGGISLGSYQAGVNWGLTEFVKLVRDSSRYRSEKGLPLMEVAAITGASAGNINAALNAIEYCRTARHEPPDSSLGWKAWVYTGWSELFPQGKFRDPNDPGVLDRGHFKKYIEAATAKAMQRESGPFVPSCDIPIGISVTKLVPGELQVDKNMVVPTQRYAALFKLKAVDGAMRFVEADTSVRFNRSLGARLSLAHDNPVMLENADAFTLFEASASYPVAFAPRSLRYRDPDCESGASDLRPCKDQEAKFMDGGVFDNNPIGMALGIYRATSDSVKRSHGWTTDSVPRLVYVEPDALRGRLKSASHVVSDSEPDMTGVTAVFKMLSGFVPTARKYELQGFARNNDKRSQWIRATTRAHPIIGEHLNSFAAFFGRPFR